MTILAFGCSVTHGADLVKSNQHEDNIKYSYPNLVADMLSVSCLNYATCGISNEGIFHSFLRTMHLRPNEITAVIVGWTSTMREYWVSDNREWFIIPSWCATAEINKPLMHFKDYTDRDVDLYPRVCADQQQYMEPLAQVYDLITRYKFDQNEYLQKKLHYVQMVRMYCQTYNIKLIETCCIDSVPGIEIDLNNFGQWRQGTGHPTKEDHQQIAIEIISKYER